ncbi:MAG: hypothetical protein U1E36_03910 [Rickettsiales bacterium]
MRPSDPIVVSASNQNTSAFIAKGDAARGAMFSGKPAGNTANSDQAKGFQPQIGFARKGKEPLLNWLGFHIDTTAIGSFYGLFRFGGYVAQGGYNKWEQSLNNSFNAGKFKFLENFSAKRILNTTEAVGFTGLATTFAALKDE